MTYTELEEQITNAKLKIAQVCIEAGVAYTTIWRLKTGVTKYLYPDTAKKMQDAIDKLMED